MARFSDVRRGALPRRLVVAGVGLAAIFVVGVLVSRLSAKPQSQPDQAVAAAPRSTEPSATDDGGQIASPPAVFAVGEAQAAAVDVVGRTGEVVAAGFISRRELIETFTTPEFGPTLADETGRAIDAMLIELGGHDVDVSDMLVSERPLTATSAVVDGGVRVQVWSVLIIAAPGTGPGRQVWRTVTLAMDERDGVWLVDGWQSTPGPTPAPAPESQVDSAELVADRLAWDSVGG